MNRTTLIARTVSIDLAIGLALAALILAVAPSEANASDTATRWDQLSEASSCGSPYTKTPYASRKGWLPATEKILGPFGSYFGRSVAEIQSQQVYWTVPFSGGRRVKVHRASLPAFQEVAEGLAAHAAEGRIYQIRAVGAFYPRTIGGSHQVSRHALGIAIDINPAQNPHRSDGRLITDMPGWFVDVWRDAGFCWGGDWRFSKDAMHFSWIGPGVSSGSLDPRRPATSIRSFGNAAESVDTVVGPVMSRYSLALGDATGNGAPDVIGLRSHPGGAVLDIASGIDTFGDCSVRRRFLPTTSMLGADHILLGDIDGDSGQDLITVTIEGGGAVMRVATVADGMDDVSTHQTPFGDDIAAIAAADFNEDHVTDIWVASGGGGLRIYDVSSWDVLFDGVLPSGAPGLIAAADRDGGDTPELFALYGSGSGARLEVLRLDGGWAVEQDLGLPGEASGYVALGAGDYDGDGRADVQTLDSNGRLRAYIGNSSTGHPMTRWFVDPEPDCDDPIRLAYTGTFFDDDSSVHQNGIEWIAGEGITAGCNPPFNDRFCTGSILTRAQAVTFLVRALGIGPAGRDYFDDDDGHTLEGAINRAAEAGITAGCSASGTEFCPNREMTRAEFAVFIARALSLPSTDVDYFTDDDGSVFEGGINRLADSGITQGCNPPANDHFCGQRHLTRAETATFLTRAFK